MRKIDVDELFATDDSYYVLADLGYRRVVIEKLVVSTCASGTHGTPREDALAATAAIANWRPPLQLFDISDIDLNEVDLCNISSSLIISPNIKVVAFMCTAASLALHLSVVTVISHRATLTKCTSTVIWCPLTTWE